MFSIHNLNQSLFTGRGSTALYLILKALSLKSRGILVPSNVCEIVVATIRYAGYQPVFTDVDPISGNAELRHFQSAFNNDCKIILAVPNFGTPINISQISEWAKAKNLFLIEDMCNATGSFYENTELGTIGDAAIYSFGYAKIIEFGIGGLLTVKNEELRKECRGIAQNLPEYDSNYTDAEKELTHKLHLIRNNTQINLFDSYTHLYDHYSKYLVFRLSKEKELELKDFINKHNLEENLKERKSKARIYQTISHPKLQHRPMIQGDIVWRYTLLAQNQSIRDQIVLNLRENNFIVSTWYPSLVEYFSLAQKNSKYPGYHVLTMKLFSLRLSTI